LSEATSASRSTEKDLNSRIAKFPGKAEWDKKDEAATLKALRTGEIPDPYSVKKSKPEPPKPQPKPQAKPVQRDDDDDDEATYDEDEDEDEVEESIAAQEKSDYSRYGATANATQIFGNTDEYLFWTGMVFLAGAIGTGVVGFLQNTKYIEADKAVRATSGKIEEITQEIEAACDEFTGKDRSDCIWAGKDFAQTRPEYDGERPPQYSREDLEEARKQGRVFYILEHYLDVNNKTRDSYNTGRMIFFGAAGLSAAISIILFAW